MADVNLKTFVSHPKYDDFWAEMNPETQAEKVPRRAGVFLGGWYDIFLQGTINSFLTIQEHGGQGAEPMPAGHRPVWSRQHDQLKYPPNSDKGPACRNDLAWFDYARSREKPTKVAK